jgi:hypothetical protein
MVGSFFKKSRILSQLEKKKKITLYYSIFLITQGKSILSLMSLFLNKNICHKKKKSKSFFSVATITKGHHRYWLILKDS